MIEHVIDEIDPKVLGARLHEARRAADVTQQAVAEEMGMARTTVVAIEKGERRVNASELLAFARLYGRSVSEFVNRSVVLDSFVPQFRIGYKDDLEPESLAEPAALELQRLTEDYLHLETLLDLPLPRKYPPQYETMGVTVDRAAEEIALAERHRLGLGDGPLAVLRKTLESDVGLRIFYIDLPNHVGGVFAYQDVAGGCIAINRKHPPERQTWSLAHEYGHFLTSRFSPEIMILRQKRLTTSRERLADRFAANFLMPSSGLNRRYSDVVRSKLSGPTLTDICVLADLYRVSVQALVLRLEDLERVSRGTWDSLAAKRFRPTEAQRMLGIERRDREHQLPSRFVYLAVQAFRDSKISEGQLAKLLRSDRVTARETVAQLDSRVLKEDEGDFERLTLNLTEPLTRT